MADPHYLSDCHNAAVHLVSSDEGTNYYECVVCKEGCNYHPAELAPPDEQLDEILDTLYQDLWHIEYDKLYEGHDRAKLHVNRGEEAKAALLKWHTAAQQQLLRELMEQKSYHRCDSGWFEDVTLDVIQHKLDEIKQARS